MTCTQVSIYSLKGGPKLHIMDQFKPAVCRATVCRVATAKHNMQLFK